MAETYFDTKRGKLLIGEAAIADHPEQELPGVIVPLYILLTAKDFPYDASSYPKLETKDWQGKDHIQYGQWLMRILTVGEETLPLTQLVLQRMHWLGLGPPRKQLLKRSGAQTMTSLKNVIEAPRVHMRATYDTWTIGRFMDYGLELEALCEGKPSVDDYIHYARIGKGPTMKQIDKRWGGITKVDEFLGYPNVDGWSKDDYLDWGVRVLEANNGSLHWTAPRILAGRMRGPTSRSIFKHCGPWAGFYEQVQDNYSALLARESRQRAERAEEYRNRIARHELPYSYGYLSDNELLSSGGRYRLAASLLPDLEEEELYELSLNADDFSDNIRRDNPHVTLYDLETTAQQLGVFKDTLVPRYVQYLHVAPNETQEFLARKNRLEREHRQARLAS